MGAFRIVLLALLLGACSVESADPVRRDLEVQGESFAVGELAGQRQMDESGHPIVSVRIDWTSCQYDQVVAVLDGSDAWADHVALTVTLEGHARGDGAVICVDELPSVRDVLWGETYLLPGFDSGIAAHEIGHQVGLEHASEPLALMAVPVGSREPTPLDLAALHRLYPPLD